MSGSAQTNEPEWLTVEEVAAELRLSPATVYRALAEGRMPGAKLLGCWRIYHADLEEWLASLRVVPKPKKPKPQSDFMAEVLARRERDAAVA